MSISNLKRLQKISHRMNRDHTEVADTFMKGLKHALSSRGHRADLVLTTDAKNTSRRFTAAVRFDTQLGHPSEEDLVTLAARAYPTHEIDWNLAEVDSDQGIVLISLTPSTEMIPIKSLSEIPPEFQPIGTGLYKRAVDSTANEIWTLKRGEDGLVLYKNPEMEVTAEEGLKAGDVTETPYGVGRILRFDEMGNAFVQVGNQKRLVAAAEMKPYSIDSEKQKIIDYYTQAYGDAEFAKELAKDYSTVKEDKSIYGNK